MLYLESACKMDLKRGQFPVVSAYSNGDGCSDGGAFDNGPCFFRCNIWLEFSFMNINLRSTYLMCQEVHFLSMS